MPPQLPRRRSYLPVLLEFVAANLARVLYRVRSRGTEHLPATGGVLLIVNHLSYIDPVVLQVACPRPIRFIGYKGLRTNPFFDWAFRMSGALSISATSPAEGLRQAIKALRAGEVVAIFPEGHISRCVPVACKLCPYQRLTPPAVVVAINEPSVR